MKYLWSAKNNVFFLNEMKEQYEEKGWDFSDAILIDDEIVTKFMGPQPANKIRTVGDDGFPSWGDLPSPTPEELRVAAEARKQSLVNQANEYMNGKQWPGKAAIGRLIDVELKQYEQWLDYLDALLATDTSSAPDITWPTQPE
ncbi:tail fiber assembly protein [Kosakonia sp. H02]|nr:tail fiber assembly protein [Kosakonia sp. H02]